MRLRWSCVHGESSQDCGPAALATVAHHHGVRLSLVALRQLLATDAQGTTLARLRGGAERVGFAAAVGRLASENLGCVEVPFIAHYEAKPIGHFVVVHRVSRDTITVADPALGVLDLTRAEFLAAWSGQVLLLTPSRRLNSSARRWSSSLWQLVALAAAERDLLMLSAWFALILAVIGYAMSFLVSQIVDNVLPGRDVDLLWMLGTGFLGVAVLRALVAGVRQLLLATAAFRMTMTLGGGYVQHLLSLPIRFFDLHQSGELLSRLLDAQRVSAGLSGPILTVLLDVVLLMACGLSMLWYSVPLTLLTTALVPAYLTIALATNAAVWRRERKVRAALGGLADRFVETVTNLHTIKGCAFEGGANALLESDQERLQQAVKSRARLGIAINAGSTLVNGIAAVVLLWVGAVMVLDRRLTTGQLIFFYSVAGMFLNSVERLAASVASIQEATVGLERLSDVRQLASEHDGVQFGLDARAAGESMTFDRVSFGYRPESLVLEDVSLVVRPGSTLAVVGETGCGKSTLVSLAVGLYQPISGRVLVNGRDVADLDKVALRRHVALVTQDPGLMSGTLRANISLGCPGASTEQIEQAAARAAALSFIRSLPGGLDYQVGFGGRGLSSGQRQRIAIARALLRNPKVLILDEATSNLDPETERTILDALELESGRRTTIIATHRIAIAARADHILVMERGAIVEQGGHHELLNRRGKYHAMWQTLSPGRRASDTEAAPADRQHI